LQSFLGATNTTALDYDALWAATGPPEAAASSLDDFLTLVYPTLIGRQQYNLFAFPFYADYAAAHNQCVKEIIKRINLIKNQIMII
jgi:hypothetical protein